MKRPISIGNVLEALGALETAPTAAGNNWEFYKVSYPTPAGKQAASYLSLSHDCPLSEASSANLQQWRSLSGGTSLYSVVVTKKSRLAEDLTKTAQAFRGRNATTARQLLYDNVVRAFMPRTDRIEESQYFVEPDVELADGSTRRALNYLVDSLLSKSGGTSSCADVLVAPAGLGKTTIARAIARKVLESKSDAIPILVESAQWQNLLNLTLPNVLNAALLQLIPDAVQLTNPKLFQLLVREQLLVPIFDGFDELCLHPSSSYNPTSLITALLDLVGDAGAKVLITTRETFWEKYGLTGTNDRIERVNLQGFSNDQRQRFFSKRLKSKPDQDVANRLAKEVGDRLYESAIERPQQQAERASGVPLLLELVALYVDGNPTATFAPSSNDPIGPLLEAVCERENVRQQLNISADKQMKIFEELFRDSADDIKRDDLALYIEINVPGVTRDALQRFESHALFSPGRDVRARFESLKVYFIARWLASGLQAAAAGELTEGVLAEQLERNASGNTDVFDFLVDRFKTLDPKRANAAISHALRMMQSRVPWDAAVSALFHLALRLSTSKDTSKERTSKLLSTLGVSNPVSKIAVHGQIGGLDLSGVEFADCIFRDVEFHNCSFDGATQFSKCKFIGGLTFENSRGAGQVRLLEPTMSEEAEEEWNKQFGRGAKKVITEQVVREGLREIFRKFLGPYGFSTIKDADKNTGPLLKNPCRDAAWDELFRHGILDRHHISGVSEGGINIATSSDVRHEVRNFLDNAALGHRLRIVLDAVLKRS